MKKQIAVDELTSGIAGQKIETHDVITSPNQPVLSALDGSDLITVNNLNEAIPDPGGSTQGMIPAGTAIPFNVAFTYGSRPVVTQMIKGVGNTLQSEGANQLWKANFSDAGLTVLASVDIYPNNDGSGGANEDTYYVIRG